MAEIVKTKNKGTCELAVGSDLEAISDIVRASLRNTGGRPAIFPNTEQGIADFRTQSMAYFDHVAKVNAGREAEKAMIPDIESWATFLGLTRQSIFRYEKRSPEWNDTIQLFKNAIAAYKKQMGMHYKIPPMVLAFDFCNNHQYCNTSEFKMTVEAVPTKEQQERQALETEIRESGLVWDSETNSYIEDKGAY
jgi:hypothetical protein